MIRSWLLRPAKLVHAVGSAAVRMMPAIAYRRLSPLGQLLLLLDLFSVLSSGRNGVPQ